MDGDAKLQSFLLLAKGAKGRSICDLIVKATAEQGLYHFGELLDAVQGHLADGGQQMGPYRALLELFCYGTWPEYQEHKSSLPALSPQHELKIKQLTVASLGTHQKVLPYELLQQQLAISTVRDLEDFIITDCFYTGLVVGKLDQRQSCLQVHDVASRDVRPTDTKDLAEAVGNWLATAQVVLQSLEGEAAAASAAAAAAASRRKEVENKQEELKKSLKNELERTGDVGMMLDEAGYDVMDDDRLLMGAGPSAPGPAGLMGRTKRRR